MNNRNNFLGIIFVALGTVLLISNIYRWNFLSINNLWPFFILIPGLVLEWSYFFKARDRSLLVPGGILTTLGLLFFFETFTGWQFSAYTWPFYPLSVAIGLFQLYLFSNRPWGLLIPVFILSTISIVSYSLIFLQALQIWVDFGLTAPIILILFGLFIIFRRSRP